MLVGRLNSLSHKTKYILSLHQRSFWILLHRKMHLRRRWKKHPWWCYTVRTQVARMLRLQWETTTIKFHLHLIHGLWTVDHGHRTLKALAANLHHPSNKLPKGPHRPHHLHQCLRPHQEREQQQSLLQLQEVGHAFASTGRWAWWGGTPGAHSHAQGRAPLAAACQTQLEWPRWKCRTKGMPR